MWAPNLLVGGSSDLLDYSISSWTVAGIRHQNPVWMATVEGWHFVISKSTTSPKGEESSRRSKKER